MSSFVLLDTLNSLDKLPLLLGFSVTVIATWLLCRFSKFFRIGLDSANGVQKFHINPTSRLGGVAIFLGLAFSGPFVHEIAKIGLMAFGLGTTAVEQQVLSPELHLYTFWFLLAAIPVWLAGLTEDLTHKVGPTPRLIMAIFSAAWLFGALGVCINRTDVWPIDLLLGMPSAPLFVTLLVVAGFTHSVNIMDGFHGLACGLVIIALSGLAILALKVNDALILQMCLTFLAVVFGFFVFNWPKGAIFLGDAGAYLIGFCVVELGILLAMRNPQLSPMAPVVVGLLPLIETLFSMYRRNVVRDRPINQPDAVHLHTLVYRRLLFNPELPYTSEQLNALNAKVAIFFWMPAAIFAGLACFFAQSTEAQLMLMLTYLAMYNWLYKRLVLFKAPVFMQFR